MTIVFFDTETTGLPRDYNAPSSNLDNWPRLVQLAWIVSDYDGNIISSESHIIIPDGFDIPSRSAAIHGITTSIAKTKGENLVDVIDKFLVVLQNAAAIAGHNISFDQHIVEAEILRCGRSNILNNLPAYCTMKLSANYCNILNSDREVKWPTLQELYSKLYRENFEDVHNAMADIQATYRCFFTLVKLGVIKLEDECADYYRGWKVTNKRPFTETKKIGLASFADCKRLQKVDIPENVTKIDAFAFENDESLKYVTINANIQAIEQGTFRGCSSLKEIIIPEGVKSIRQEAFKDCTSLETIRLPYSIEELGDAVFEGCTNLKRIELPSGIKVLSRKLFHGCKTLNEVDMPSTIEIIGSEVFEGCESLNSIVLPTGVKEIWSDAFSYSGLREVIIPDTVTKLGKSAFCECRNLHSALIPGSIKTIPDSCFHGCRSLSQITICEGVESIEDAAFRVCPSLKKLFLPEGMKKFGEVDTLEYSLINDLYVPSTLENIVPYNRGYGSGYVNLHVPLGMKAAAEKCIEDDKNKFIEVYGHCYDYNEPSEIFEYSVVDNLIVEVLEGSKNTLTVKGLLNPYASKDIVIPSSALIKDKYYRIARIETNAFYNVTSLNSIKISDGITSIGAHAFSYCSSLKKVEFPASLTDIEGELFYGCNNLESIFVDFDNTKFLSVNGVLYTKDHKKIVAYPNANGKDYKIIDGTEYIENFAFKSCVDLENLRLPKSIRVIGDNVFYGCDKLKKVVIPNGLEKIGILQERTNTLVKYKDVDYTITQLVNLIMTDIDNK